GQRMRPGVLEHPLYLRHQDSGLAKRLPVRTTPQFIIRHAAPQKVRQARSQLVLADEMSRIRVRRQGIFFDTEQEMWRHQHALDAKADALLLGSAMFLCEGDQACESVYLLRGHGTPERPARQIAHDLPSAGGIVAAVKVPTDEDLAQALL